MASHFRLPDETMSSLPPQEDIGTDTFNIKEIGEHLTKHIRYLESWINQFKKIPPRKVMLKKFKNEVWNKMCKSCRSKLYDLKGTDFPYLRDIHTQTSIIPPGLQIDCKGECPTRQANSSDKQSEKGQQSYNIAHPLKDQENKEDLKELNDILRKPIRTQKVEIKNLELEVEKEKMKAKNTNDGPVTETKKDQTGAHGAAYWRTLNDDLDQENKRLRRVLDHAKAELDSVKRERDDCVKKTAQQQISTRHIPRIKILEETKSDLEKHQEFIKGYEKDISDQQTEKQTLKDSFSRSRDEMRSTNKRLQQEVELLTHELEQKNEDFDKAQGYLRDVSELQTQKQTLEDTLTRTKDDMSSATERMQQEIDRLTAELERKNEELHSAHEENRRLKRKVLVMRLLRSGGIGKAMADIVTKDITRWLDGRFDSRYVDFSAVHGETTASVLPGVLFVMCMNQPNQIVKHIQDAVLLGTKDGRDVYVLVISNTTKENLAHLTPTRDRVSSDLQPSGGIIDMAFSSVDGGLYECDLNKSAINRIETIIHKL